MSINIIYTDLAYNLITDQQIESSYDYLKQTYENGDLKIVEHYSDRKGFQELVQIGGLYYLRPNENLDDVIDRSMAQSKDWTFYFNRIENAKKDTLWNYQTIYKGELKEEGKKAFDVLRRVIAYCVFEPETRSYVAKVKKFWGDPVIFPTAIDSSSALTFYYEEETNMPYEVYCEYGLEYEYDYSIDEFQSRESIMAIFPWDQHSYYHNFEPMLP